MRRLSGKLQDKALLGDRPPSLQFAMSAVMRGMSVPKVLQRMQVVRVARYILQHPEEIWLFNDQADPKSRYVYTDMDRAADELTRKSVSCTVERYGSHMLDCSVAKQSLVALSSSQAEFYGIVRAVATSKQTSQILEQIGMMAAARREGCVRERDLERYGTFQWKNCGYRRPTVRRSSSWCLWILS